MESGILLLDKPEGPSSAYVVRKVKAILGARKVGHLGTLDPFASGLLPLGINEGTKIAEFFEDEVDAAVADLLTAIEPLMILVLGVLVGGIVVSMYLPLFSLISKLSM